MSSTQGSVNLAGSMLTFYGLVHLWAKVFGTGVRRGLGEMVFNGDPPSLAGDNILFYFF